MSARPLVVALLLAGSIGSASAEQRARVVVAADGSGDFTNLQDAIAEVDAGGTVLLKPGVHRAHVRLRKPLVLMGEGPDSIIEGAGAPAIVSYASGGRLRDLTIIQAEGGDPVAAVCIEAGDLVVDRVFIRSEAGAAIVVRGDARPAISRSTMQSSGSVALHILGSARGSYRDNHLFNSRIANLSVGGQAQPIFTENIIDRSPLGIRVDGRASGHYQANQIRVSGAGTAILIRGDASPAFEANRISVAAPEQSATAIMVSARANATLAGNHITGAATGLRVADSASATVISNQITGFRRDGIAILSSGTGRYERNRIAHGPNGSCIRLSRRQHLGRVTLLENQLERCRDGLRIVAGDDTVVERNIVRGHFQSGIVVVRGAASLIVQRNTVERNGTAAIRVDGGSAAQIRANDTDH